MMNYERPMLVKTEQMSEGVYLASGVGCYTASASAHQAPELGRENYRIQVNGKHSADHTREAQTLIISFNLPVTYVSGGAGYISGNGTTTLTVALKYHQNTNDNIGLGDLIVTAGEGLEVLKDGVAITD